MQFPITRPRSLINFRKAKQDGTAGVVLGVESVPDGLASGLLAGVNPVAGLYAYMFGVAGAALFTGTAMMAVQGTGAMAIIVADVDLDARDDPARALYTLSILTGIVMIAAGFLHLGRFLRFVSTSVMTGFITAVGVNIVLGQLDDFSGYTSEGGHRVTRTIDLLMNLGEIDVPTLSVGVLTIVLIVGLQRTPLGALGLVVAVFASSLVAALFKLADRDIAQVSDIADIPRTLPLITAPQLADVPVLLLPACSLAFVGLVQGAAVSAGFPNADGSTADVSQDFVGQGAGNIAAGLFQGMPVGGSMSASSLSATAGAHSRAVMFYAAAVMAVVILLFGSIIELVAMPALAGLLIVVGIGTVRPERILSVARTGAFPFTVMTITFALTMLIPLQYAVLVGVGISVILYVGRQSTRLVTRQLVFHDDGGVEEVEPVREVPPDDIVVLQPYGAVFFATAPTLLEQLPTVTPDSTNSWVILRIRGADEAGASLIDVLRHYASELDDVGSRLVIVTDNDRVIRQLHVTGITDIIGDDGIYHGTAFIGQASRRARADGLMWIHDRRIRTQDDGDDTDPRIPRPEENS